MREITRKVYETDDGKVFETEAAAKAHEAVRQTRAKRTTYWAVNHNPDLTEGRGHYGRTYVECFGPQWGADGYMQDWCFRTFGRPIAFVMGVSPMPNWTLHKITEAEFLAKRPAQVGDYKHDAKVVHLVLGDRETGLVETNPAEA